MTQPFLAEVLRPGDTVLVGQATAEPPLLVAQLIDAAEAGQDLTALCGYALDPAWGRVTPGRPRVEAYAAHGALRRLAAAGAVEVLPMHLSRLGSHLRDGRLPIDVVLLQVGPMDDQGCYPLGATIDYAVAAAETARAVFVEVNEHMPRTHATRRLHRSLVTAAVETRSALVGSPTRPATDAELAVARNVAALVPDGATIQLGASALAAAIAAELHDRRGLRVRSGLLGDWVVGLFEAGAMAPGPATCVASMALGTERLYHFIGGNEQVLMAPMEELLSAEQMPEDAPYISMNSALEIDVLGQVNAEVTAGRYVGAVGGQVDFFRAAQASDGGLAIVALAAGAGTSSRIVSELSGPVTCSKSDVDIVVTEWGAADLRTASLSERATRLAGVAHPDSRAQLLSDLPAWVRSVGVTTAEIADRRRDRPALDQGISVPDGSGGGRHD